MIDAFALVLIDLVLCLAKRFDFAGNFNWPGVKDDDAPQCRATRFFVQGYGANEHGLRMVYQTTGGLNAGHTILSLEKPGVTAVADRCRKTPARFRADNAESV